MKRWIKHFIWFIKESSIFCNMSVGQVILKGGLAKAYNFANDMCKWDKATAQQREDWYCETDRTLYFND